MLCDIQAEIIKLKKEKKISIYAHSYQSEDIIEVADFVGDSFQLSKLATEDPNDTYVMCGVHFMAETMKILSPQKKVILANGTAGCPMAEQFSVDEIRKFKEEYPDYAVVAYINTTAELKTVCDVCVTSGSALKICEKIENKNILFIPDCNLGGYVAKMLPEKNVKLIPGGCPIHAAVTKEEVEAARKLHPNAKLLVHPECTAEVVSDADYIGSTAGIMKFAKESDAEEFIIGTENSIVQHLQFECPDKKFYPLSKKLICCDMKATTLIDLYNAVKGTGGVEIEIPEDTMNKAKACIDEMLRLEK